MNFCKTPGCENYGVPPVACVDRGRTRKGTVRIADGYSRSIRRKRRGITCLHRGSFSAFKSNAGCLEEFQRVYSPYNPAIIQKLLDIYRVYYNYCAVGKGGKTPAMRLGLAKGKIRIEDILYFDPAKTSAPVEAKRPRIRKPYRKPAPMIQPRLPAPQ